MRGANILVVDDDEDITNLINAYLCSRGHRVTIGSSGEDGIRLAHIEKPDLILLDIEMPDRDGIEVCQEIRRTMLTPIIFLTVRAEETDVVLGLGVGADNYITKPFKLAELTAKIEATLRRETVYAERRKHQDVFNIGELALDLAAHEVRKSGNRLDLTPTEFKLLQLMAENAGHVLTREQLLDHVWEMRADGVYTRTVDVHVGRLRKKIEDDPDKPRYIITVAGLGYKMAV
ncbi:MAG: response regulator transcription factor [Armatimonadota bacterium]|nr:response regulator transcription factor [Armatimonadota bacterium]